MQGMTDKISAGYAESLKGQFNIVQDNVKHHTNALKVVGV